jgi:NAD(P)-dependent dehydrogenase (short-subunit alcohol dehydrogenase family)
MTDQMLDYTDKVVLVTGGATGIGRATALLFAAHGAAVVIGDIDEQAKETISLIEHAGGQARFVQADVTRAADMERLVGATIETFGGLHAAFNNAGVLPPTAPLADMSEADWDRIIDVDLKGVFLAMKYELTHMPRAGGGAIVNTDCPRPGRHADDSTLA